MPGEPLIRWTVRLALLCYAFVLVGGVLARDRGRWQPLARTVWSLGCLLFLGHVVSAFHFYHDWSHASAFRATADETRALLGWRFGSGIFFNYAFALLWTADAAYWWRGLDSYGRRPRLVSASLHGFMLTMAVSGAIVFEQGPTRWLGILVCLGLMGALWWRRR